MKTSLDRMVLDPRWFVKKIIVGGTKRALKICNISQNMSILRIKVERRPIVFYEETTFLKYTVTLFSRFIGV